MKTRVFSTLCVAGLLTLGGCLSAPPPGASPAALENTYWKLLQLGETAVTLADGQTEPHMILQSANDRRVTGSSGCNRMTGSYTLEGTRLTFSQMAGTRMACQHGMDTEAAFHAALPRVQQWVIRGEQLELLDAAGQRVALFESVYLR